MKEQVEEAWGKVIPHARDVATAAVVGASIAVLTTLSAKLMKAVSYHPTGAPGQMPPMPGQRSGFQSWAKNEHYRHHHRGHHWKGRS